jgi:hypothetical protein
MQQQQQYYNNYYGLNGGYYQNFMDSLYYPMYAGMYNQQQVQQAQMGMNPQTQIDINQMQVNMNEMNMQQQQQQQQPPQPKVDHKQAFIKELRERVEAYFKLIVRNLRDSIPKNIGNHLVKSIQLHMQMRLYNMLYKSREIVNVLNEPESVTIRRKELNDQIKVLKEAQKIIRKDPDLMQVMQIDINDADITGGSQSKQPLQQKISNQIQGVTNKISEGMGKLFGKK